MRMIQSSSNPRIRNVQKLLKNRNPHRFVIEGKKLVQEAIAARIVIEELFATPEYWALERASLEPLEKKGTSIFLITPSLLKSVSTVETPQGVLAVAQTPSLQRDSRIGRVALFLISIRDPGNFGAIVRTAEACGVEWIGYSKDCVDPFQPKVVRASMGSLFRVPLREISDPFAFLQDRMKNKVAVYGLAATGNKSLLQWKPRFPLVVCIGSESHGLPEELPLTEKISIPMMGKVESLNAAVAAAVFLYALQFQTQE